MVAAPQLQFGSRGGYSRLTTQEGVTVYNSDFIFSFACAATTWAMFARVGLHAPPPAVLNGGDRWRLMVLATGYHCVVMLWRVGRSDTSE